MRIAASLLAAALIAGAAAADAAPRDRNAWKAATPSGKPIDCLRVQNIRETRVRDDRTIDFYMLGGKQVYRNTLPQSCPSLGFEQRFAYRTQINQLCAVDTITVLMNGPIRRGATCGLGQFQPITGAPR